MNRMESNPVKQHINKNVNVKIKLVRINADWINEKALDMYDLRCIARYIESWIQSKKKDFSEVEEKKNPMSRSLHVKRIWQKKRRKQN